MDYPSKQRPGAADEIDALRQALSRNRAELGAAKERIAELERERKPPDAARQRPPSTKGLLLLARLTEQLQAASKLTDMYTAGFDATEAALGCERGSMLLFDAEGVMRFVAWRGLSEDYRKAVEGHSPWTIETLNPQPICVPDIDRTEEPDWLKSAVKAEGIRALAFIPLVSKGRLVGKFMAYYATAHDFSEDEIALASTIGRQLGLAIARQQAEEELRESEQRFRLMSEHAPVMIWMSDVQGRCLHLNRMLRDFWAVDEADIEGFDWRDTLHPDDAPAVGAAVADAIANMKSVRVTGRYRSAQGRYRTLQTDARPRFSSRGQFLGMIGVNVDVTEREEAEAALRSSEQRFRLAVEAAPSGMVMADGEGRIVLVNAQAEKLFGYSRDELIGRNVEMLLPDQFRANHPSFRDAYRERPSTRPMGAGRELFARRKDGTEVPVEIGLNPIHASEGVMALAAVVDISERKRAEAQRDLLVAELNHRVKNTLAVVQAIAHQTFRNAQTAAAGQKAFEGRLVALALAHNLLTETNWENASLAQLAALTFEAAGASGRVTFDGPDLPLSPKEAVSVAMALHELSTNARKYGALSNDTGRIRLAWQRGAAPKPTFRVVWEETGGPPVEPPARRGFGSFLLERTLARDLFGTVSVDFRPQGLVCVIDAPLGGPPAGRRES